MFDSLIVGKFKFLGGTALLIFLVTTLAVTNALIQQPGPLGLPGRAAGELAFENVSAEEQNDIYHPNNKVFRIFFTARKDSTYMQTMRVYYKLDSTADIASTTPPLTAGGTMFADHNVQNRSGPESFSGYFTIVLKQDRSAPCTLPAGDFGVTNETGAFRYEIDSSAIPLTCLSSTPTLTATPTPTPRPTAPGATATPTFTPTPTLTPVPTLTLTPIPGTAGTVGVYLVAESPDNPTGDCGSDLSIPSNRYVGGAVIKLLRHPSLQLIDEKQIPAGSYSTTFDGVPPDTYKVSFSMQPAGWALRRVCLFPFSLPPNQDVQIVVRKLPSTPTSTPTFTPVPTLTHTPIPSLTPPPGATATPTFTPTPTGCPSMNNPQLTSDGGSQCAEGIIKPNIHWNCNNSGTFENEVTKQDDNGTPRIVSDPNRCTYDENWIPVRLGHTVTFEGFVQPFGKPNCRRRASVMLSGQSCGTPTPIPSCPGGAQTCTDSSQCPVNFICTNGCCKYIGEGGGRPAGTCQMADLNNDGRVDMKDVTILMSSWGKRSGQPGFNPRADINQDGKVDALDASILVRFWNSRCSS